MYPYYPSSLGIRIEVRDNFINVFTCLKLLFYPSILTILTIIKERDIIYGICNNNNYGIMYMQPFSGLIDSMDSPKQTARPLYNL